MSRSKQQAVELDRVTPGSLTRALDLIGDPWALGILRRAFQGSVRFQEFQSLLDMPRQTLSARLARLADNAILYKKPVRHSRLIYEYHLTPKGLDLYSCILMIWRWHKRWHLDESILPSKLYHHSCGRALEPILRCAECHDTLKPPFVDYQPIAPSVRYQGSTRKARILNEWEALGDDLMAAVVIGDSWSLLVLNAVLRGVQNYDAIQRALSISSNTLAVRLKTLLGLQLLEQQKSTSDRRMSRYVATEKAEDIYPIILSLVQWGNRWLSGADGPPDLLIHSACGQFLVSELSCEACGMLVRPSQVSTEPMIE